MKIITKDDVDENNARSYLEEIAQGRTMPGDFEKAVVVRYSDESYIVHIPTIHRAIRLIAKGFSEQTPATFAEGLVEVAKMYCKNPLMIAAMGEWYCAYTPSRNKGTTPEQIKREEYTIDSTLAKILDERMREVGLEGFKELERKLSNKTIFRGFAKH